MARRKRGTIQRENKEQEEDIALQMAAMQPTEELYHHFDREQFNPLEHLIEERRASYAWTTNEWILKLTYNILKEI